MLSPNRIASSPSSLPHPVPAQAASAQALSGAPVTGGLASARAWARAVPEALSRMMPSSETPARLARAARDQIAGTIAPQRPARFEAAGNALPAEGRKRLTGSKPASGPVRAGDHRMLDRTLARTAALNGINLPAVRAALAKHGVNQAALDRAPDVVMPEMSAAVLLPMAGIEPARAELLPHLRIEF
jgi:hypothetical protein